ncbi:hypothetical protein [Varunaivibrio sulfuroxidans]|uniref:Uncharacterized protein n=1 Tax=Varunaivibrio sulfuroxidans TaxID=1773489 RepID=A0A4V2UP12_9PROT|nr:hypothetical protein [Varunaivibrio sulfuroxidans]TCS64151.1 hypothetical protein EDD55_102193 [Varunaivibrio sulfuroxidans]WES31402.1 hypothetical protein P3M64_03245 [Varunaivibrio sulfuroxidans]
MKNSYFRTAAMSLVTGIFAGTLIFSTASAASPGAQVAPPPRTEAPYPTQIKPVALEKGRLILPERPKLSAPDVLARNLSENFYEETYVYNLKGFFLSIDLGFIRFEEQRSGGYAQISDHNFRDLARTFSQTYTPIPFKTMKIQTLGTTKYAQFPTKGGRNCVVFSRVFGKNRGPKLTSAVMMGVLCDINGSPDDLLGKLVSFYIEKITLREKAPPAK